MGKLPSGWVRGSGHVRRIVVSFDEETFDQVRELARKHKSTFAEQVRILVDMGLTDVDESEKNRARAQTGATR